jgi:F-type H+-transporting ATPase subunit b
VIRTTTRAGWRLAAAALVLVPALAWAEDPHAADAQAPAPGAGETVHAAPSAHGAEEAAHAAPSLFSVEPGLLIWTIITFLVVLVVLRLTAWGPMMKALAERENRISGAIAQADRIKAEAESLLARYETLLDKAKDEARGILDEARRDGLALRDGIREKAHAEAEEFKARAHREIELAKDGAVKELWDQAASLSTELATRILGRTLDATDQERLVRELIREMRGERTEKV